MDIRSKKYVLMGLVIILLTAFQCTSDTKLLEEIPESQFVDNCPDVYYDFGQTVYLGDPNDRFMIRLPYSWDIRESYTDSIYGLYASNFLSIPVEVRKRLGLSVSGYEIEKNLQEYVHDELIELIKDEHTKVMERGESMFAGIKNPWVLFEMQGGIFNMVYYVKHPKKSEIYLIQAVSYDTLGYRNKMCQLKQLVNSFEIVEQ